MDINLILLNDLVDERINFSKQVISHAVLSDNHINKQQILEHLDVLIDWKETKKYLERVSGEGNDSYKNVMLSSIKEFASPLLDKISEQEVSLPINNVNVNNYFQVINSIRKYLKTTKGV